MVFEVPRLQKWSKNYQKPGKILSERFFLAFEGFDIAKNDGICTGLRAFPAQNPVNIDGFKLCRLQSGHKLGRSKHRSSSLPYNEPRLFFHGVRFKVCSVAFCLLDFYQGYL